MLECLLTLPRCLAPPEDFAQASDLRTRKLDEDLRAAYDTKTLWETFGFVSDVTVRNLADIHSWLSRLTRLQPFTFYFPRADIHELLTPDLLHQLIKGTFKDHIVAWVEDYICATAETDAEAKRILDDIDRR